MKHVMIVCAAVALALSACDKKSSPEETTSTTGAASPAEPLANDKAGSPTPDPAAQTATAAAEDNEDIPTEADFEEEAEQKITSTNLEQELKTLEKEIGK